MSKSGFDNEDNIRLALDGKYFDNLNNNLKRLIESSFSNYTNKIKCVNIMPLKSKTQFQ